MIGAIIFILGSALQTGAQNLGFLYSGRAIAGIGVGFLVMIIPLYQAEISHPTTRGRLTGLQQFMIGNGAIVAGDDDRGPRKRNPANIASSVLHIWDQ